MSWLYIFMICCSLTHRAAVGLGAMHVCHAPQKSLFNHFVSPFCIGSDSWIGWIGCCNCTVDRGWGHQYHHEDHRWVPECWNYRGRPSAYVHRIILPDWCPHGWKTNRTFSSNPVHGARDMSQSVTNVTLDQFLLSWAPWADPIKYNSNTMGEREGVSSAVFAYAITCGITIDIILWSMVGWQWKKCSWASFILCLRSFPLARLVARPTQPLFSSSRTQSMRRRRAEPSSLKNSDSKDWRSITA